MKTKKSFSLFKRDSNKKKAKPKKPDNIYYSPADSMSKPMQYIGLALRTLVLYIGVFGLCAFICGAAGLSSSSYWNAVVVSPGIIALLSLPVALAAAAASLGRLPALITPVVYAGIYSAVTAIAYGNPITFTVRSALRVYNYALHTLSTTTGYTSFGNYIYNPEGYDYSTAYLDSNDPYRFAGVFLLATLIGCILYFCVQKKARLIPTVILFTAVLAPILTYNIAKGNAGIAFILVFICSAVALKVYDHRYGGRADRIASKRRSREEKKKQKKEKKARKKEEIRSLREEADRVFDKAIDADMPLKQAKKARKAVFKAHKNAKKASKKNAKIEKKLRKAQNKKAEKEKKLRIKKLKKQIAKAKGSGSAESLARQLEAETSSAKKEKEDKKNAKEQKRKEKKERTRYMRKVSMAGGFAGIGVALCAFIAVFLPMLLVDSNFLVIKPLDDRLQTVRTYVTAYLKGGDVNLNDPYVYGLYSLAPREVTFDPLELKDDLLFRVDAEGTSNVYLRSWVGKDLATDSETGNLIWISANNTEVLSYRELFGKDFTPDSVKTDFYSYVYPASAIAEEGNTYKNFTKYGFTVQKIDVWRVKGSSLILFVPAHMNTNKGLLAYDELSPAPYKYQNYYDGIYSSFFYRYGRGYSTVSYVTAMNRADAPESIENSLIYYRLCLDLIRSNPDAEGEEATSLVYAFEKELSDNNIEFQGTSIVDRYYFSMNAEEKSAFLKSADNEDAYGKYVNDTYTQKTENEALALIAKEIADSAVAKELENGEDGVLSNHEAALAVVEYFRSGDFTYTKTPDPNLTKPTKNVIEAFLTDVKQGYCSHFASSAAVLLREMGVPTRYAEGYIATDFEPMGTSGAKNRADIYATDAHAWVEVYIDDMGWMQYEVTPGQLCEDMYDPNSDTVDPTLEDITGEEDEGYSPPPFGDEPDIDEIISNMDDDYLDEEKSDLEYLLIIIIVVVIVAAVGIAVHFAIRHISKKASKVLSEKFAVIDSAKNIDVFFEKDTDNRKTARRINDWILDIFSLIGCEPRPGELPDDFVARMRQDYGDLSTKDIGDVMYAMQKEEFGHGVNYEELNTCAEYLEDITASVYASMNPWQKIVNRYFKRKI